MVASKRFAIMGQKIKFAVRKFCQRICNILPRTLFATAELCNMKTPIAFKKRVGQSCNNYASAQAWDVVDS
jgi:hypothetical protein